MTSARRYVAVVCILLAVVVVNGRVVVSGNRDIKTARLCMDAGLIGTAIDFYGRAARWYSPFSSTSSDAILALLAIAEGHAQPEGRETALKALYEARAAILASRWLVTPHRDELDKVNSRLASLQAESVKQGEPGSDPVANLALLQKTSAPAPIPALFSTLLFLAWMVVTVVAAGRSVTPDGRFNGRQGIVWISVSAALLFGWLVLLALA